MKYDPTQLPLLEGDLKKSGIESLFDQIADKYDQVNRVISLGFSSLWRQKALSLLELNENDHVLDVGCGTGMVPYLLKKRYPHINITGIDLSEKMLHIAQKRLKNVSLIKGDVTQLPFKDNQFDLVTTCYTLRNFPNIHPSLQEIFRVVRPSGSVLILDTFPITHQPMKMLHQIWLSKIAPFLAAPFSNRLPYHYMYQSIKHHITQQFLIDELEKKGIHLIKRSDYTFKFATAMVFKKGE